MLRRASCHWALSVLLLLGAAWLPLRANSQRLTASGEPTHVAYETTAEVVQPDGYFIADANGPAFRTLNVVPPVNLTTTSLTISAQNTTLTCTFIDASPTTQVSGEDPAPGRANTYTGNDPEAWNTAQLFGRVKYSNLYPGIDLLYSLPGGKLKSEHILQPGVDPQRIKVHCPGATLSTERDGQVLVLDIDGVTRLREALPAVYQPMGGTNQPVEMAYRLLDAHTYSYDLREPIDPGYALVIDPILLYSAHLGGTSTDEGWSIAADREGSTYVSGITISADFPTTSGSSSAGDKDVFVAKYDRSGRLAYATVIGGASGEEGNGIAVDDIGNAYVAGETFSRNFPLLNAWQPEFVGYEEAFVLKLDTQGRLSYSTYIGGARGDEVNDIVADAVGNVYLGGEVYSDDYPLLSPWSASTYGDDEEDGFITIFDANGAMAYSTLISAPSRDQVFSIAVDASGYVYGTGMTSSPDFPRINAYQTAYGGDWDDCFVFKLDPWNNEMIYSTLLGGSGRDECWGIAVDDTGAAYVTGFTSSEDFPLVNPLQSAMGGWDDIFIAKLAPAGDQLLFSTYIGGEMRDRAWDLSLDGGGNVYVVGETESPGLPNVDALQGNYGGQMDGFIIVLDPEHTIRYASYLGGPEYDRAYGLAVDGDWLVHIAGATASAGFPDTSVTSPLAGGTDAYIGRYALVPTPTPTPTPIPETATVVGPEGATLWLEYPGHVTVLTVPSGYVADRAVFTLTYEHRADQQGELTGLNHYFAFDTDLAPQLNSAEPARLLPGPLELTLAYAAGAVVEDTVHLRRLDAGAWITDGIAVLSKQPEYIRVNVLQTGTYGLLGESNRVYLPSLLRQ